MPSNWIANSKAYDFIHISALTALPEEGSIKSAKYPAAVNLEQISLALSMNYKRIEETLDAIVHSS